MQFFFHMLIHTYITCIPIHTDAHSHTHTHAHTYRHTSWDIQITFYDSFQPSLMLKIYEILWAVSEKTPDERMGQIDRTNLRNQWVQRQEDPIPKPLKYWTAPGYFIKTGNSKNFVFSLSKLSFSDSCSNCLNMTMICARSSMILPFSNSQRQTCWSMWKWHKRRREENSFPSASRSSEQLSVMNTSGSSLPKNPPLQTHRAKQDNDKRGRTSIKRGWTSINEVGHR